MEIRKQLARRLRDLMDSRPDLDTQTKVAERSGVGQSTIQRLLALDQSATVDMLEKIAEPFGLNAWEMLIPDGRDVQLLREIGKLNSGDKSRILGFIELALSVAPGTLHHGQAQLLSGSSQPVPPQLFAAKKRASARKPGADIEIKRTHGKAEQKRRGGRSV